MRGWSSGLSWSLLLFGESSSPMASKTRTLSANLGGARSLVVGDLSILLD